MMLRTILAYLLGYLIRAVAHHEERIVNDRDKRRVDCCKVCRCRGVRGRLIVTKAPPYIDGSVSTLWLAECSILQRLTSRHAH